MSSGVTIVKVGGNQSPTNSNIIRTTHTDNVGRNSRLKINLMNLHFNTNLNFLIEL